MHVSEKIQDEIDGVTAQELSDCEPTIGVQEGDHFAGGTREKSIAPDEIARLHCLCVRYWKVLVNGQHALARHGKHMGEEERCRAEHDVLQANRKYQSFFLLLAISVREQFPEIPPGFHVDAYIRKGWSVVWIEKKDETAIHEVTFESTCTRALH